MKTIADCSIAPATPRADAPAVLVATGEFRRLCPASAVGMTRERRAAR